ncbi:DUF2877 domain-containing protein [Pseudonocardia sp. H11422]|uniref:oxamate carbamoyltransferase subunit AllH family protein n=1 Tax=Pseudonocardia sp. H11422 TaxID=2835866 RepID=UPI001BDBCF21|nr:DUF2877 domain-containing protein [Pseudonocardia sp. H11422]
MSTSAKTAKHRHTDHPDVLPAGVAQGVRDLLEDTPRGAHILGTFPTAVYLSVRESAGGAARTRVFALLTADAIRLPCGLVLGVPSSRICLPDLVNAGPVVLGGGALRLGPHTVTGARTLHTRMVVDGAPLAGQIAEAGARLRAIERARSGLPGLDLPGLLAPALRGRREAQRVSRELVGRGPGLTPAGDDVLAGFLVAATAFRLDTDMLLDAVLDRAIGRTPDLSAQLLRHAGAGEGLPQVQTLLTVLTAARPIGPALDAVLRIGHSSGYALASGVHAAAALAHNAARHRRTVRPSPSTGRRGS